MGYREGGIPLFCRSMFFRTAWQAKIVPVRFVRIMSSIMDVGVERRRE